MKTKEGDRKLFVVNGKPFYISTGKNSGMIDTAFPVLGISETSNPQIQEPIGYIINLWELAKIIQIQCVGHLLIIN
ncbi:hypothetical protein KFE69_07510 [bacterium SCSIO 12844]|nr:hypothetical protein KFE69_07510 [bacterium SCSIO 12844]